MTSYDFDDGRHYENKFMEFSLDNACNYLISDQISPNFKVFLVDKIQELLLILNNKLSSLSSKDVSIYTGLSGIAYFYYKLSNCKVMELSEASKKAVNEADYLIKRCLRHLKGRPGSIMCDDTGPLTMSVLCGVEKQSYQQIMEMCDYVVNSSDLPDEMLYGRCGYLASLLMLNKHERNVDVLQTIRKIFKAIISSGIKLAKLRRTDIVNVPPLFYEWHGKAYLGGAHGFAGIMFMLLQVYLDESLSEIHSSIKQEIFEYVYPTIEFLSKLRLPSGNYPSSIGDSSRRDVLVHWCHGAPGWIHMFIAAHKVFKNSLFIDLAKEIGEVIWKRGLLFKGCGICHGSAGNGYAFIALYQYTNEIKYLYQALMFAEWCTDYTNKRTREADRPYSLFEGLAGTLHFLVDCLDARNARFPIYEL